MTHSNGMTNLRSTRDPGNSPWRLALMGAVVLTVAASQAQAVPIHTILDQNSEAEFDLGNSAGNFRWQVDGVEHLNKQWFWYRTGSDTKEMSVDTLYLDLSATQDTNFDGDDELLFVRYLSQDPNVGPSDFTLELRFILSGTTPGSEEASISETIEVTNTSGSTLNFTFFQYVDFDLFETPNDDTVSMHDGTLGTLNRAFQSDTSGQVSESVILQTADRYQIDEVDTILAMLEDGDIDNLAYATNDTTGDGPLGPANVEWAFQWNLSIPNGQSTTIEKDKRLEKLPPPIPEPGTLALLTLAIAGLGMCGWRSRHKVVRVAAPISMAVLMVGLTATGATAAEPILTASISFHQQAPSLFSEPAVLDPQQSAAIVSTPLGSFSDVAEIDEFSLKQGTPGMEAAWEDPLHLGDVPLVFEEEEHKDITGGTSRYALILSAAAAVAFLGLTIAFGAQKR